MKKTIVWWIIWLITMLIVWCINYFVLRVAGIFLGYTFTTAECTGIYILLMWVKALIGGSDD